MARPTASLRLRDIDPDALVMHWEMVPPKDMDAWECLAKSWEFVRSLEEG